MLVPPYRYYNGCITITAAFPLAQQVFAAQLCARIESFTAHSSSSHNVYEVRWGGEVGGGGWVVCGGGLGAAG